MGFTTYATVNSLSEFGFLGGNDFSIIVDVTDDNGGAVNVSTASSLTLKIAPYGQPSSSIYTATGLVSTPTNRINFVIPSTISINWIGGIYMYQPIIVDSLGVIHRPKQGTFILTEAIK